MTSRRRLFIFFLVLATPLLCALTPGTPEYYVALAQKHAAFGRTEAAFDCLDRAISLAPDMTDAYVSRAFLRLKTGERELAVNDFTRVIELRPDAADIYVSRGLALAEGGERERAQADYRRACEIDGSGCAFLDAAPDGTSP